MLTSVKAGLLLAAGLGGAVSLCPLCGGGVPAVGAQSVRIAGPVADTAVVRLHISGMTCGSCPTTARLALQKLAGVFKATVTLDDSLGVVHYDPRWVTPPEIVAQLSKLTDYRATIIPDSTKTPRRPATD
jgi:copper chaperone CopZ